MTSNLDLIRGRQVVQTLTNQSGGSVIAGDVVIIDTANDESFTTTTSAAYTATQVCIALESIASTATGRVLLQGYAPLVNVSASATRGYYLFTHTVAKQATSSSTFTGGAFGQVLKAGTTPSAYIFPPALSASIGVTRSGSTTGNNLAVWNGSNADSLKDGGVALADGTWTDYSSTSTVVGWGSTTVKQIYYKTVGKTVFVAYQIVGTSNSATTTFTLPATCVAAPGAFPWIGIAKDNGGAYVAGYGQVTQGTATATLLKDVALTNFSATGQKEVYGQFWYVST